MNSNELDENILDKAILTLRPLGYILEHKYGVPSELIDIFAEIIPGQRIDRMASFLKILDKNFSDLKISCEQLVIDVKKQKEYFSLLENGLFHAYRASSYERLEYISSMIVKGLTQEQVQISQYIYLLNLLSELNDEEVIWLRFYLKPSLGDDKEFRKKHINVLERPRTFIGAPEENLNKAALQDSYLEHLERLGLIESKVQIDKSTNLPVLNKSGRPKTSYRNITRLGQMLLKEIGLYS